jgi:hypothetical protein
MDTNLHPQKPELSRLLDDRTCTCGARAERRRRRCAKCRARAAWRHHHERPAATRRPLDRVARRRAASSSMLVLAIWLLYPSTRPAAPQFQGRHGRSLGGEL